MKRDLTARWKAAAAVAVTAAFFVPLLVLGGPAFARSGAAASEYEYSGSSQYQYRMPICHHTHSKKHPYKQITISSRAWKAHQRHGDTPGTCPATTAAATKHHGSHGDSHAGKGSDDQSASGESGTNASGSHGGGHGHGKP